MVILNSYATADGTSLELSGAASQYFDVVFWITLGVALLVSIAAFIVMHTYVRRIFLESQRGGAVPNSVKIGEDSAQQRVLPSATSTLKTQIEEPDRRAHLPPPRSPTFENAKTAARSAAGVYAIGGFVYAAAAAALLFVFERYQVPSTSSLLTESACYAAVFWAWSCVTITALVLFWGPDRRRRTLLILAYLGILPAMGVILGAAGAPSLPFADVAMMPSDQAELLLSFASAVTGRPVTTKDVTFSPLLQPLLFWGLSATPITIPFLAFNRFVRGTVGPLFITLALMLPVSTLTVIDLMLHTTAGVWFVIAVKRLFADRTYAVLVVISFMLAVVLVWYALRWIVHGYRHKLLSDQTFLFDAIWLSASLYVSVFLMGKGDFAYLLGLLPLVLCKFAIRFGLKPLASRAGSLRNARLLFLRVFGSASRTEKLFDLLAAKWRYAGSIQLISSTDIARGRFEPDELMEFLGGRLAQSYISSETDLERRLQDLDLQPDPDGRYRINEFFCRADTWQQTVTRLMLQSDLVVMDLRGFTEQRRGCVFELGALLDSVPLDRVALLIDKTTDQAFLQETLTQRWRRLDPRSPNAGAERIVRMIHLGCGPSAAARHLMQLGDTVLVGALSLLQNPLDPHEQGILG